MPDSPTSKRRRLNPITPTKTVENTPTATTSSVTQSDSPKANADDSLFTTPKKNPTKKLKDASTSPKTPDQFKWWLFFNNPEEEEADANKENEKPFQSPEPAKEDLPKLYNKINTVKEQRLDRKRPRDEAIGDDNSHYHHPTPTPSR